MQEQLNLHKDNRLCDELRVQGWKETITGETEQTIVTLLERRNGAIYLIFVHFGVFLGTPKKCAFTPVILKYRCGNNTPI